MITFGIEATFFHECFISKIRKLIIIVEEVIQNRTTVFSYFLDLNIIGKSNFSIRQNLLHSQRSPDIMAEGRLRTIIQILSAAAVAQCRRRASVLILLGLIIAFCEYIFERQRWTSRYLVVLLKALRIHLLYGLVIRLCSPSFYTVTNSVIPSKTRLNYITFFAAILECVLAHFR